MRWLWSAPGIKGVKVRFELDASHDLVFADKVQVQQVVLNLIRNAIEAMAESPRRELVISSASAEDEMVQISVADSGSGLSPDVLPQLFQPFVTTKKQGMGVGLSDLQRPLSKRMADGCGPSQIKAARTVFHLTLKLAHQRGDPR